MSSRSLDKRHTTSQTTSERFRRLSNQPSQPLTIDEDVSIVIERKVRGPPSTEPLVRRFDPDVDAIRLPRRTDEGSAPVFQRPEVLKFHHDRLTPEPRSPPRTYSSVRHSQRQHSNGGSGDRERRSIHMSSSNRYSRRRYSSRSRSRSASRSRSPVILRLPPQPPRRVHDRIGGRRFASLSPSPSPEEPLSPLAGGQNQRRFRRRPIAERLGVRPVKNFAESGGGKFDSNRLYYRPPPAAALDPLATPKAPSYFLHDDRGERRPTDGDGYRRGGRGGGGRGFRRGGGRFGGFRGGGGGGIEGKWQHDKFVDNEDEAMGSSEF
ncbi:hypothetical protein BOX15_Mlig032084g1 [Macrostomum lignano]|uniref:Btz domain-containing protein n=2 Tax=Macrostomum lignano TaxID=282301 RepID=A0A1I8JFA6_9PLAT|nr:hypothetical protein BOX15_Mlig032084g1 [Macrostomum lignano]